MISELSLPPKNKSAISSEIQLASILEDLIGKEFKVTGKSRTDGSNLRNIIAEKLVYAGLPEAADSDEFLILPPKKKGVPRILRQFIDTYIVTSGTSYNLQVWNRMPASQAIIIEFKNGETFKSVDVRFILVKIDTSLNIISSIIILTPEYIEKKFGKFGKPTIKHQLLISQLKRNKIIQHPNSILLGKDTLTVENLSINYYKPPIKRFVEIPTKEEVYALDIIYEKVAKQLIGKKINAAATKNRGQYLENLCLDLLGYNQSKKEILEGGFPDIRNQLLEVKVQDSQTVDLGKYSPEFEEIVISELQITTKDIRYLIALTDKNDEIIKGIILCSGDDLINHFVFVSDKSYKSQRTIPMDFFDKFKGRIVINPE